jgi:hypothetical protein
VAQFSPGDDNGCDYCADITEEEIEALRREYADRR